MNSAVFLLVFAVLWKTSLALRCYKCHPEAIANNVVHCPEFDYSEKFIVDCPHSTFCMKKDMELNIFGVISKTTERGCAPQTMDGYQEKDEHGNWRHRDKIFEVYDEGCQEENVEFGKPTKAIDCFCRGDLCNSAVKLTGNGLIALATILTLWMVFKC